jgi:rhodanese-related sulfurtransferase
MNQISPAKFHKIKNNTDVFLLDVRTREEFGIVNIGGFLMPINKIIDNLDQIPRDKKIIVLCHHGVRSANVVMFLIENDFKSVLNLSGGIDRYALEIDNTLKRY